MLYREKGTGERETSPRSFHVICRESSYYINLQLSSTRCLRSSSVSSGVPPGTTETRTSTLKITREKKRPFFQTSKVVTVSLGIRFFNFLGFLGNLYKYGIFNSWKDKLYEVQISNTSNLIKPPRPGYGTVYR